MRLLTVAFLTALLLMAPMAGFNAGIKILQTAAEQAATTAAPQIVNLTVTSPAGPPPQVIVAPGGVSPSQLFQLALSAWGNTPDAILATAVSLSEDGSGNPTAISAPNKNRSYDF